MPFGQSLNHIFQSNSSKCKLAFWKHKQTQETLSVFSNLKLVVKYVTVFCFEVEHINNVFKPVIRRQCSRIQPWKQNTSCILQVLHSKTWRAFPVWITIQKHGGRFPVKRARPHEHQTRSMLTQVPHKSKTGEAVKMQTITIKRIADQAFVITTHLRRKINVEQKDASL